MSSNKLSVMLQLLTPLIFCGMLLAMRASTKPIDIPTATDYVPLPLPYTNYTDL